MTKMRAMRLFVYGLLFTQIVNTEVSMAVDGPGSPTLTQLTQKLMDTKQRLAEETYTEFPYIDTTVRAQDDFFEYANGQWLKTVDIPADKERFGAFIALRDTADLQLKTIIETLSKQPFEQLTADQRKILAVYQSYLDEAIREQKGFTPLKPYLSRVDQLTSVEQLPECIAEFNRLGISTWLGLGVGIDPKADNGHMVIVGQGGLGLPDREYYLSDEPKYQAYREKYLEHIKTMLSLAKLPDGEQKAKQILEFEHQLAQIHWTRTQCRDVDKSYNKYTQSALSTLGKTLNIQKMLQTLKVDSNEICVRQPDVMEKLNMLLQSTSIEQLKSFLEWKVICSFGGYLNKAAFDARFDFYSKTLNGTEQPREPQKRALDLVNSVIGEALGKEYVARYFSEEAKTKMVKLVDDLKAAYKIGIERLDWMEPATKAAALKKLDHMTVKVGYPDQWRDYSGLEVNNNDLMGNIIRSNIYDHEYDFAKLGKPINRDEWLMCPQTVNAYNMPPLNDICFPAAILQPPFFSLKATDAMNYGGIGGVIAHEMGHGFDDQGRKYDHQGKLKEWWTEQDARKYQEKTEALVSQYDGFEPLPGLHVNGRLTLGENVADLTGMSMAMLAYELAHKDCSEACVKNFDPRQQMFLAWAQIWQVKARDDYLRKQVTTDPHSPGQYRCNGILQNLDAFYDAFDVKENDNMYLPPQKRVKLWG